MAIPAPAPGCAALVTGASSGIGAELARQLCAAGHDVILVARRRDRLQTLAIELRERHGRRVEVLVCDVADASARTAMLSELGALGLSVSVLVLSAGFGLGGPFIAEDADRITMLVRTNLESTLALCRAVVPGMTERRSGAVLLVSSMAGNQPMPHFAAYAATKAAVTSFAQSLGSEVKPYGVTVTALAPGGVSTEFSAVAGMEHVERRARGLFVIGPEACARAGLDGLAHGRRVVMPTFAVKAGAWLGAHLPRAVWLPLCRKLLR